MTQLSVSPPTPDGAGPDGLGLAPRPDGAEPDGAGPVPGPDGFDVVPGPGGAGPVPGRDEFGLVPGPDGFGLAPGPAARTQAGPLVREWRPPFPVNVRAVMSVHRRGRGDPAYRTDEHGCIWRTCLTPAGPATLRVAAGRGSQQAVVTGAAWGPGAGWVIDALPAMLGAGDDSVGFEPHHAVVRELLRRHGMPRVGRSGRVMEALVPAVLEQKVTGIEAHRAWRTLLLRFGWPAPGPVPGWMRVCPDAASWAAIPSWEWHRAGVEAVRARTIAAAARLARRMEEVVALPAAEADLRLQAVPGIGPWTSAEIRQRACGDPDAVSVGDYHLPSIVGWALTGRKTDDAGMLELLAPYAGHRHRAVLLIERSGAGPPRRGPRMAVRDYRTY